MLDESDVFLLQIAGILIGARIGSEIAVRLGAAAVIGELVTGVVLGPSLLGWFEPTEIIRVLAEIGIILLLFEVGLETDLSRLARSGGQSAVVAVGGVIVPFGLGFLVSSQVFGHAVPMALFVGGTLTATSIGVTVRILRDVERQNSHEGQVVIGAAVLDDLIGVLLLAVLYDVTRGGEVDVARLSRVALLIAVFFLLAPVFAKLIGYLISHYRQMSQLPGLVASMVLSLVMLSAWLAHEVGAPELLGGFAAGLALSRRFFLPLGAALGRNAAFAEEVNRDLKPIVQLFTPFFFVSVGLSLDLRAVDWNSPFIWLFSFSIAFVAIAGKIAAGYLLFREHWLMRTAIGMSMVPRGEVGLVFAELGRASGLFNAETYAAMVLVVAYTTLFSPFWIKLFYRLYGHRPELAERSDVDTSPARGETGGSLTG